MTLVLAALTCLHGGCATRSEMAAGIWEVRVVLPDRTCEGQLQLQSDDANVRGTWSLCGRSGEVRGAVLSNELVLSLRQVGEAEEGKEPADEQEGEQPVTLRVSLNGDYFDGDVGDGSVEGWRGDAPQARDGGGEADPDDAEDALES